MLSVLGPLYNEVALISVLSFAIEAVAMLSPGSAHPMCVETEDSTSPQDCCLSPDVVTGL